MVDLRPRDSLRESSLSHPRRRRVRSLSGSSCQTFSLFMLPKTSGAPSLAEMLAAQRKLKVRWSDMSMRRYERLLEEYCLGKAGWRIGELMGENQAYPLWLYPRIHVHSRDPTGSLRTSSDWTIKQTTWSPIGDISVPTISHQTPICQRPSPLGETQPPVLSLLSVWFIFGYVSHSLSFPLFHPITHSPFTPVSSFH